MLGCNNTNKIRMYAKQHEDRTLQYNYYNHQYSMISHPIWQLRVSLPSNTKTMSIPALRDATVVLQDSNSWTAWELLYPRYDQVFQSLHRSQTTSQRQQQHRAPRWVREQEAIRSLDKKQPWRRSCPPYYQASLLKGKRHTEMTEKTISSSLRHTNS